MDKRTQFFSQDKKEHGRGVYSVRKSVENLEKSQLEDSIFFKNQIEKVNKTHTEKNKLLHAELQDKIGRTQQLIAEVRKICETFDKRAFEMQNQITNMKQLHGDMLQHLQKQAKSHKEEADSLFDQLDQRTQHLETMTDAAEITRNLDDSEIKEDMATFKDF